VSAARQLTTLVTGCAVVVVVVGGPAGRCVTA
jgi:hypothetical protein